MANFVFNVAKGKINQYMQNVEDNSPAGCEIVLRLYKTMQVQGTVEEYDTASAVDAANSKCDATGYVDKVLAAADITPPSPDDTNNWMAAFLPDTTWSSLGGAANNTLVSLIVYYDPVGTQVDANMIPLTHHDFSITTNGSDITADFDGTNGFYRAT